MAAMNLESMMFEYIDQVKLLISPESWSSAILDCSKNEIFTLILLYQRTEVNMTQIADYIEVPLNTATGIIARMEKKGLVCRQRSEIDKRVVTITLTESGQQQFHDIMKEFFYYGEKLMQELSAEELSLLNKVFEKLIRILKEENIRNHKQPEKKIKKIVIE